MLYVPVPLVTDTLYVLLFIITVTSPLNVLLVVIVIVALDPSVTLSTFIVNSGSINSFPTKLIFFITCCLYKSALISNDPALV